MTTQDYAASVQGVALRVTRLDAAGNLLNGPGDSYTTTAFLRASFTPEYEEGDEIVEKSADGTIAVSYKAPDTLKRITMEIAIARPDVELSALLSGGLLLRKNYGSFASPENQSIGWASPGVGDDPSGNGVAIEVWSFAVKDGKRASTNPYFYWIFPYAKLRQSGDRVIENGLLANTFEGYGLGNTAFGSGLDGYWEYPVATDRPYSYARASWAPEGLEGFYRWHDVATNTISTKSLTSNVATITTGTAHGFEVGQTVAISDVDSTFNGTHVITAVPSTTQFRFAKEAADVASTPVSPAGTVVRQRGYLDVADFESQTSTTGSNVPGADGYNPDLPIDFIVASTEDPTE